jgi:hypothetical protein
MIERRKVPQPSPTPFRLYTLQEVAAIFHVPLATVRFWRSMRRMPVIKVGRKALVEHMDLLALIASHRQPGASPNQPLKFSGPQGEISVLGALGGPHGKA